MQHSRIGKIFALLPPPYANSDDSGASTEDELEVPTNAPATNNIIFDSSDCSSLISIDSELERLNILQSSSDEDDQHIDEVSLTPILHAVCPLNGENNYDAIPSISSLPSLPSITAEISETPNTPIRTTRRKRRQQQPKTVVAKKIKKIKKFTLKYTWKKTAFLHRAEINIEDKTDSFEILSEHDNDKNRPLSLFNLFFSTDMISEIVEQTNMYSVHEKGRSVNLKVEEFHDFLAIHIMMGIVRMPAYTDYWSRNYRFAPIADLMSLKRYQQIRRCVHFTDNNLDDGDRYFKVRPVFEKVRRNCLKLKEEKSYSIDEMMIPYKGTKAGNRRQYIQNKPNKWGFKNFVRAGASGLIYDFIIYGGEDTLRGYKFSKQEVTLGLGALVVLALCKSIRERPAKIFADNFFTSPELLHLLRENYGIFCVGTIRSNRLRGCDAVLPSDKDMKKKMRGSFAQAVCNKNKLAVVKWHDNKCVTLISSCTDAHPVDKIKRYCKVQKKKVDVDCPSIVKEYNKSMGGVDLADMLISLYRIPLKTKRWYMIIFAQLLDICLNNAWLLHRKVYPTKPLKQFRLEVYESLIKKNRRNETKGVKDVKDERKIKNPVKPRPNEEVRYDQIGHFPDSCSYGRCRHCKDGKTNVICVKCNQRLCFVAGKRNCFLNFHKK